MNNTTQTIKEVSKNINLKKTDLQNLTGEQKTQLNQGLEGLKNSLKQLQKNSLQNTKTDSDTDPRAINMSFQQSEKAGPLDWKKYDRETKKFEHLPQMQANLAEKGLKEAQQGTQNTQSLDGGVTVDRNKLNQLSGKDQREVMGNAISEMQENVGNNLVALRLQEREKLKIEQKEKDVTEVTKTISDLNDQLKKSLYNEDGRVIPMTFISGRKAAINRNLSIQIGEQTALLQGLNGELERAENTLKETMATHKEALSYKTNSMNILFDMAKTKATEEEKLALEKRQREFQRQQAAASRAHAVRMKKMSYAMEQGWGYQDTMDVVNGKKSASSVSAKYENEKKEYDNNLLNAVAMQYIKDGSINTTIYKELQSQGYNLADVQKIARDSQSKGSVVDKNTGGKTTMSSETMKRVNGMRFINQQLEKLKSISDEVGNSSWRRMGSKTKAEYNKIYDNVVDKLARLRTGAALTADEETYYKTLLPGFHTTNHVYGASRSDYLQTMINTFKEDINNNLETNNAVLVGYNDEETLNKRGDPLSLGANEQQTNPLSI